MPLVGYGSIFHLLSKGWVRFIFRLGENVIKVLKGHWFCNMPTIIPSLINAYVDIICGCNQSDVICEFYFNV